MGKEGGIAIAIGFDNFRILFSHSRVSGSFCFLSCVGDKGYEED